MNSIVEFITPGDPDMAESLRELADRVESGEVRDCVVVYDDLTNKVFASSGTFRDRWRVLGALEYAKAKVNEID
jgi:hypothetical protein